MKARKKVSTLNYDIIKRHNALCVMPLTNRKAVIFYADKFT